MLRRLRKLKVSLLAVGGVARQQPRVIIAANLNYVISCAPGIREMKKKIELDCYKKKSSGKNGSHWALREE
jgi:hypothetical protein